MGIVFTNLKYPGMKRFLITGCLAIPVLLVLSFSVAGQDYTYYNDQAKAEYDKKNYYQVIDYATRSINASANGAGYWYRGMARYYVNNYPDAADDFSSALLYYASDNSSMAKLYYWRGLCRYEQQDYKTAVVDFESAVSYGHESKLSLNWDLAYSYYRTGDYKQSLDHYTAAMNYTSDPADLSKLYKGRGDVNKKLFKDDDAINDYTRAIEYDASYEYAYWERGIARVNKLQYELAMADYTSAINLIEKGSSSTRKQDLAILYSNRGRMHYLLSHYDDARGDLQRSLDNNPNYAMANWNMADLLFALDQYKPASVYYLQAASQVTKKSDKESIYSKLYQCSVNMLDYAAALSYINQALQLNDKYGDHYAKRGHVYLVKKNYPASIEDYTAAIRYYEDDKYNIYQNTRSNLYISRAKVKWRMKDNSGALADLQQAVEEDSSSVYAIFHLGKFYKQVIKQDGPAQVYLKKTIDICTAKDSSSWYAANAAYAKVIKGDKAEAFTQINNLIDRDAQDKSRLSWDIYDAACIYALAGDLVKALQYLDRAFAAGFMEIDHFYNDEDLDGLRALPGFKTIQNKYHIPQPVF